MRTFSNQRRARRFDGDPGQDRVRRVANDAGERGLRKGMGGNEQQGTDENSEADSRFIVGSLLKLEGGTTPATAADQSVSTEEIERV